ncbi:hypothetical protein UFOVP45_99 [uncultured Caudovirales phage]|uniref:Uncharacterized protein n=1 Tax=uncultured Caudovirales phage TaxID=2100421 RepID=A0A6J5KS79_9CAUD|nr:hypothetical protein UFOVP45_99 [uncultured Caudovirales phage]
MIELTQAQIDQLYLNWSAFGAEAERQRIIKLLEDKNTCDGGISSGNCTCTAIALIKGEN